MSSYLPHGTMHPQHALIALSLIAALSASTAAQDKNSDAKSAQKSNSASNDQKATVAKGETVTELDKAIFYIFQARDNTYWFGSDGQGVYRYNGKTITRFTTNDGLVSNRIRGVQEDKAGNIYFTTYEGISRFDGQTFTTLIAPASSSATEWKKQPDDLWFVGALDTGAVYRYDGKSLHRLELPKTKIGEDAVARVSRSQFPNAKYSPYDVYTIVKDSKGNLWFGTAVAGICRFDGQSFSWMYEKHLTEIEGGGSFGIRSILEDKEGAFWICNTRYRFRIDPKDAPDPGKGLIKYKRETGTGQLKAPDGTDMVYFMSITEDNKRDLWMATYGSGV
ncbi:MAG TPA: two-component regulator propeller domain-containing protein, partial [Blastocatellia bacterium]|nr:two-component regulator propeller domain-containing protein [Blastocatellia bacterium]